MSVHAPATGGRSHVPREPPGAWLSRRRLLELTGAGVAAGSAAFLAACGGSPSPARSGSGGTVGGAAAGAPGNDVDILNVALGLEHLTIAAYERALAQLEGRRRTLGRRFLGQEREHARALTAAIVGLGGTPNRSRPDRGLPPPDTPDEALRLALRVEQMAVAAYLDAIPKFARADLRAEAASVLTVEAEHISVLLGALGRARAPSAFVVGSA